MRTGGAPGDKTHGGLGSPMTGSPWSFYLSDKSTQSLQQFVNYSSGLPTLPLLPVEVSGQVSCDSLHLPVRLLTLGRDSLPCDLTSLTDLRRAVDLSVCSVFSCCWDRVKISRLLICWTRNRKSLFLFCLFLFVLCLFFPLCYSI